LQAFHRAFEPNISLLAEAGDADITDTVAFEMRANRLDLDRRAGQLDVKRGASPAPDRQSHLAVLRATHLFAYLEQRHSLHQVSVEMGDDVPRFHAGARCRRIVDRRYHFEQAVLHQRLNSKPTEYAPSLGAQLIDGASTQIVRVRIERGQHALDCAFDQRVVADLVDVIAAHLLERVTEQIEFLVGLGWVRGRGIDAPPKGQDEEQGQESGDQPLTFHAARSHQIRRVSMEHSSYVGCWASMPEPETSSQLWHPREPADRLIQLDKVLAANKGRGPHSAGGGHSRYRDPTIGFRPRTRLWIGR